MITLNGVYTSASIFTTNNTKTNIDPYAAAQIQALCDNPANKGCKIRVMPDVHPGKVGTIGFTQTIGSAVLPNVVGIDIGCGITLAQIKGRKKEFQKLDSVIRENIPSGFQIRNKPHHLSEDFDLTSLFCIKNVRTDKALLSLGTLGGGNHFIEVDQDSEGQLYVSIHSGSRHLGKEVTEYYLNKGQQKLKAQGIQIPYELTCLDGELMEHYLHDLQIVQNFASLNREIILAELAKRMKWKIQNIFSCIHNYVEASETSSLGVPLLRKGAVSAQKGQTVIVPINMRDGILIGTGLGNKDWNCSAPHGAGRIMKREDVKNNFTVSSFKSQMKGIYSSCISKDTLDEAPFAYRGLEEITDAVKLTMTIDKIITPVYNFKAGS